MVAEQVTPLGLQLPPTVHATLPESQLGEGRVIVIGDVHGCPGELQELLAKSEWQQGRDTVVLVGDLVGKGLQSAQVVQMARSMGALSVRGNWDEAFLASVDGRSASQPGAKAQAAVTFDPELTAEDQAYLRALPFSLSIPSHGVLVVHAGLVPGVSLKAQQLEDLIELRHVDPVDASQPKGPWKALPKFPRSAGTPWGTVWWGPQHVIYGHHATRRLQMYTYATGIDTGCVLGDKLTALVLPSRAELAARGWDPSQEATREAMGAQLVSVPAHRQYST